MLNNLIFLERGNPKVLVIESGKTFFLQVEEILTAEGYEVHYASECESGYNIAKKIAPDVIMISAAVSDRDSIITRLSNDRNTSRIPFIMITESPEADLLKEIYASGAVGYINAPFIREELIARVKIHSDLASKTRHEKMLSEMLDRYSIEVIFDMDGKIEYASSAFLRFTGYTEEDLLGQSFDTLKHPDSFRSMLPDIIDSVKNNFTYYKEIDLKTRTGSKFIVNAFAEPLVGFAGDTVGVQCFMFDVTSKKELDKFVITDSLTGLNNRQKVEQVLSYELHQFQRYGTKFSAILLDIDDFSEVNEQFGHMAGDNALIKLAEHIRKNVRDSDTAGRWRGEEFIIVLPKASEAEAVHVAEKLRKNIEDSQLTPDIRLTVTISVAEIEHEMSITKLLSTLFNTLYSAKKLGKNQVKASSEL